LTKEWNLENLEPTARFLPLRDVSKQFPAKCIFHTGIVQTQLLEGKEV
jgi:hypothetical protein